MRLKLCTPLTGRVRSKTSGRAARRIARTGGIVLLAGYCVYGSTPNVMAVTTYTDINNYKLYAHIKIVDAKQYRCLELLWNRESRWNPRADNPRSTAYGIPQLLKLKAQDPYVQIDLGVKYIKHRYGTACKAWAYFQRKGYY